MEFIVEESITEKLLNKYREDVESKKPTVVCIGINEIEIYTFINNNYQNINVVSFKDYNEYLYYNIDECRIIFMFVSITQVMFINESLYCKFNIIVDKLSFIDEIKLENYIYYQNLFSRCRYILVNDKEVLDYITDTFPINIRKIKRVTFGRELDSVISKNIEIEHVYKSSYDMKLQDVEALIKEKSRLLNKFNLNKIQSFMALNEDLNEGNIDEQIKWITSQICDIYNNIELIVGRREIFD